MLTAWCKTCNRTDDGCQCNNLASRTALLRFSLSGRRIRRKPNKSDPRSKASQGCYPLSASYWPVIVPIFDTAVISSAERRNSLLKPVKRYKAKPVIRRVTSGACGPRVLLKLFGTRKPHPCWQAEKITTAKGKDGHSSDCCELNDPKKVREASEKQESTGPRILVLRDERGFCCFRFLPGWQACQAKQYLTVQPISTL